MVERLPGQTAPGTGAVRAWTLRIIRSAALQAGSDGPLFRVLVLRPRQRMGAGGVGWPVQTAVGGYCLWYSPQVVEMPLSSVGILGRSCLPVIALFCGENHLKDGGHDSS